MAENTETEMRKPVKVVKLPPIDQKPRIMKNDLTPLEVASCHELSLRSTRNNTREKLVDESSTVEDVNTGRNSVGKVSSPGASQQNGRSSLGSESNGEMMAPSAETSFTENPTDTAAGTSAMTAPEVVVSEVDAEAEDNEEEDDRGIEMAPTSHQDNDQVCIHSSDHCKKI